MPTFSQLSSVARRSAPIQGHVIGAIASLSTLSLVLTGCHLGAFSISSTASSTLPQIAGHVHGGQQPVSGATIQLYAANTTASQGASTALISATVLTDANGNFSLAGDYTCPSPGALVYSVAIGGNPGLPGAVNNGNLALMTLIGTCSSITSSTFITINELTTVAAVQSVAPFMRDYAHIGASALNVAGLTTAFSSATTLVNPNTGQLAAPSATGVTLPTTLANTLADILAACINSSGGASGSSTPCGNLLQYTSTSTNTIAALLSIVRAPATNVASLYGLITSAAPFQPVLPSVPTSFAGNLSLALNSSQPNYTGGPIVVDSQFHVWLLQPYLGTLTQYDSNLNLLHSYSDGFVGTASLGAMALDPSNNLWLSTPASLLEFGSDGSLKSPAEGYPFPDNGKTTFVFGDFAIDSFGNIWHVAYRDSDLAWCVVEYSGAGTIISPLPTGYCGSKTYVTAQVPGIVADASGNVYLLFGPNNSGPDVAIEVFAQNGSYTDIPGKTPLSASYGYSTGQSDPLFQTGIFDPLFQNIWTFGLKEDDNLSLNGSLNFTVASAPSFPSPPLFGALAPQGNAVDGGGNLWIATQYGTLAEISPTGNVSGCVTPLSLMPPLICGISTGTSIEGMAIDPAGNIYTFDKTNDALLKFTGLAAAR